MEDDFFFKAPNDNSGKQVTIGLEFFNSRWPLEVSVFRPVHTPSLPHAL